MRGFQRSKGASLFLSLFITLALLIHVNYAKAGEVGDINPLQSFDYMILLEGQSASSGTSSVAPFGVHTVGVIAYGHPTLSATINVSGPNDATGLAWISLMGTGGSNWGDFAFGPIPNSGIKATIDIGRSVSYAIVTGGVFIFSPAVSAENPSKFSFSIN
jgi:hypothetical protein